MYQPANLHNKLLVKIEYGKERFAVWATSVPGGRSIKKENIVNRIKDIRKAAFTNILTSPRE